MNFFKKHGKKIKKLKIDHVDIHISDSLTIFSLMPNLVELDCNYFCTDSEERVLPDEPLNLPLVLIKLTKLSIRSCAQMIQGFIESISLPALHTFHSIVIMIHILVLLKITNTLKILNWTWASPQETTVIMIVLLSIVVS